MHGFSRQLMTGLSACVLAASGSVHGHTVVVDRPQRLSDWLLASPPAADADLLALSWRSTAEVAAQGSRKAALIEALRTSAPDLAQVLAQLPATGRVLLPKVDARWLQANPAADPILQPGDSVDLPARSEWVAVLPSNGLLCLARYEPDLALSNYLRTCGQQDARERAWLVQPDGHVFNYGLRQWNREAQLPPAPGAWIWAPRADSQVDTAQSEALARFLATQGPASSSRNLAVLERRETIASERAEELRNLPVTTNDWGVIGLWQTPTARFDKAGSATVSFSHAAPYNNLTVTLQPVDWLAGSVRYTDILDLPYEPIGGGGLGGDQSYKDKSTDIKIRVLKEAPWLPQVAIGWRDILGTGKFSGEYVVASKRAGDIDVSVGLGFGYLGARGDVSNPLGLINSGFRQRGAAKKNYTGGEFNPRFYFRGPAAAFGGIQYHTPWDNLILKVEYEGNDYKHEYLGLKVKSRTPFNFGVTWRYRPWLDISMGIERGNAGVLAFSAHTQLDGLNARKVLDARPLPVAPTRPATGGDPSTITQEIERQTDLHIAAIERQGRTMTAVASNPYMGYAQPVIERALTVLHRDSPPDVDELSVRFEQRGTQLGQVAVDRDAWSKAKTQLLPYSQRPLPLNTSERPTDKPTDNRERVHDNLSGPFSYGVGLSYRQNLGGPDAFVLYQLAADVRGEWRLRDDTWFAGTYRLGLLDNYDKYHYTAPSRLPRVRTHLREYSITSRDTIPNLQLTHMGQIARDHYYLGYAGLLESMFAGVGGEYLYRPLNSRLALGFDANSVRQRGFDQKFSLRSYKVNTGHASAYWDTGFADILAKASVGQYLAGDRGVTVDLSKVFSNGVVMGVYATKTNVSAAQFGEGSFDKGLYVHIPFDALLPKSGPSAALIAYNPLIRDGGARLGRRYNLYELTSLRDPRAMTVGNTAAPF